MAEIKDHQQAASGPLSEAADEALREIVERAFAAQGLPMITPRHLIDTVAKGMEAELRTRLPEIKKLEFRQHGLRVIPGGKCKIE